MDDQALFQREADQVREVMDAKIGTVWTAIDGIRSVLERITSSVEKQAEQNTQVALMANTISHFQETFVEHRAHTEDKLANHAERLSAIEKKIEVKSISRTGLYTAITAAVTGTGLVVAQHFDKIVAAIGALV